MADPTSAPNAERIPLHSTVAKPLLGVMAGIYVVGVLGQVPWLLASEGATPIVAACMFALFGLLLWTWWSLCQPVYMTREGIELTRPPRIVPWSRVADAFRMPGTGSLAPICCIGIRDPRALDVLFLGRHDLDRVVAKARLKWAGALR